ncbi:MAG: hypothetical protein WD016_00070 [Balneolaceae bacterium]
MKYHITPHAEIIAWCLMPNHFHWLIQVKMNYKNSIQFENREKHINPLNRSIGSLQSSYTQGINKKYNRSGSLFRTRTKAKSLSGHRKMRNFYGLNCFFYIHQNPIRAGLVKKMEDWQFSSFQDYAGFRDGTLCNKTLAKELIQLPDEPKEFYKLSTETIPDKVMQKLF